MSAIEDELGETSAEIDDLQTEDTVINVRLLEVETDIFNIQNSIDGNLKEQQHVVLFFVFFSNICQRRWLTHWICIHC